MGHEIEFMSFPTNQTLESIEEEIHSQYNCHGIRFINNLFSNEELAKEYILEHDRGWYDCLAVQYKEIDRSKLPKKHQKIINELDNKLGDAKIHFRNIDWNIEAFSLKQEAIKCTNCKSKIKIKNIHSNFCPICREDMRSEKRHKLLNELRKEVDSIKKEIIEKENELFDKYGKTFWLVKIEYRNE